MKHELKFWQVLILFALFCVTCWAIIEKHNYELAKKYIQMFEADNEDYVLDVASETDTYQMYHSQK